MLYGRWTIFYFDPAKKDAMVSHLTPQLDAMTKEVAGAVQARVVQVVPSNTSGTRDEDCVAIRSDRFF